MAPLSLHLRLRDGRGVGAEEEVKADAKAVKAHDPAHVENAEAGKLAADEDAAEAAQLQAAAVPADKEAVAEHK